jgi:hypothetical protein
MELLLVRAPDDYKLVIKTVSAGFDEERGLYDGGWLSFLGPCG